MSALNFSQFTENFAQIFGEDSPLMNDIHAEIQESPDLNLVKSDISITQLLSMGKYIMNGQGAGVGSMLKMTDEEYDALYNLAAQCYQDGNYEKSSRIFGFACLVDHYNKRNYIGLGAAYQKMANYEKATKAYAMANILDMTDPLPAFHAGQCLFLMNNFVAAKQAFEGAIGFAQESKYQTIKTQAQKLLMIVNQKQTHH